MARINMQLMRPILREARTTRDTGQILTNLRHEHWRVRLNSVLNPHFRAIEQSIREDAFLTLSQDSHEFVRQGLAEILRDGANPVAQELFDKLSKDDEVVVREAVAGNRNCPIAIRIGLASDSALSVRDQIARNRYIPEGSSNDDIAIFQMALKELAESNIPYIKSAALQNKIKDYVIPASPQDSPIAGSQSDAIRETDSTTPAAEDESDLNARLLAQTMAERELEFIWLAQKIEESRNISGLISARNIEVLKSAVGSWTKESPFYEDLRNLLNRLESNREDYDSLADIKRFFAANDLEWSDEATVQGNEPMTIDQVMTIKGALFANQAFKIYKEWDAVPVDQIFFTFTDRVRDIPTKEDLERMGENQISILRWKISAKAFNELNSSVKSFKKMSTTESRQFFDAFGKPFTVPRGSQRPGLKGLDKGGWEARLSDVKKRFIGHYEESVYVFDIFERQAEDKRMDQSIKAAKKKETNGNGKEKK